MKPRLGLLFVVALLGWAWAQLPLRLTFPEGSAIEVSSHEVVFDLSRAGFPPPELPAYYRPTRPSAAIEVRLFSNLEGGWALKAELKGLWREKGGEFLSPERLEVRLDGGPWLSLLGPVVLAVGQGPTGGYRVHRLELRLKVYGDERPGTYQGALLLSLTRL